MNLSSLQSLDNVWHGPQSGDWHWEKVIHKPPQSLTHEWLHSSGGLLLQQEV